ncbi:MAG TPA: hypothetical protein PK569_21980, partial [Thermoanaerobaculia bacterium]|nr:hypothetical protein [Thermoanaerobaculia bacterium]
MTCGFSIGHFEEILALVQERYEALLFREWTPARAGRPRVFLRHDVDHSLRLACEMARVEARNGIRSTYFVQLHSDLYAAATSTGAAMLRELVALGHEVGLHYDTAYYLESERDATAGFDADIALLSRLAGVPVVSAAKHNPIDTPAARELAARAKFDPYSDAFTRGVKYISDSSMSWREGCACGHLAGDKELQVLIHPLWWLVEGATLEARVRRSCEKETAAQAAIAAACAREWA